MPLARERTRFACAPLAPPRLPAPDLVNPFPTQAARAAATPEGPDTAVAAEAATAAAAADGAGEGATEAAGAGGRADGRSE